ncbi:hypothetical protein CYY_002215 [Polysphondylium violaceum]|uniref:Paramecium surface antigen repeat-containing protein n=1 Tax=Polysphondylium violaceum TaxID=133409 RepID=A0A8J4PZR7_9MYCE|nr:hypothetical protein CYY_002215 [Polysphondylium violaceum]
MKLYISLFILLSLFTLSFANQCSINANLVDTGNRCNPSSEVCNTGAYCNQIEQKCTAITAQGGACTSASQCGTLACINNICYPGNYAVGNQTCKYNQDCFNPTLTCQNGLCKIAPGQKCTNSPDCGVTQYCASSGLCENVSNEGGSCADKQRYQCRSDLVCTYADDSAKELTCQKPYTKQLNNKCNGQQDNERIPFFIDCDIGKNLICSSQGSCIENTPSAECTKCSTVSDCKGLSDTCLCEQGSLNNNTGGVCVADVKYTPQCKDTFTKLISCCQTNGCAMNQRMLFNTGGCAFNKCKEYVCQMSDCFRATGYSLVAAESACASYSSPVYATCPNSSFTLKPSLPHFTISLLLALVFIFALLY